MGMMIEEYILLTFSIAKSGFSPIKYLGVPVSPCRLRVRDWKPLEEKGEKY
jgi:hypothetical protein